MKRVGLFVAAAVLLAVALPATASAHFRTGTVAASYRARVSALEPPIAGAVSVRISASDLAIGLKAEDGHTVLVRGYLGEPFLRIGPGGAAVNAASATAAGSGLLKKLNGTAGPGWRRLSSKPAVVWHDARVRALPSGIEHRRWALPIAIDGRRAELTGDVWREPAPSPWPWAGLGVAFLGITVALLIARRPALIRSAAMVLGAFAAVAMIVSIAGFTLDANAATATYVEGGNEIVFALVGFAFLFRGSPEARAIAGGALGLLSLAAGLPKFPALLNGIVLSAIPATAARAGVTLMLAAGAAATVLGIVVLFETIEWDQEPPAQRSVA